MPDVHWGKGATVRSIEVDITIRSALLSQHSQRSSLLLSEWTLVLLPLFLIQMLWNERSQNEFESGSTSGQSQSNQL